MSTKVKLGLGALLAILLLIGLALGPWTGDGAGPPDSPPPPPVAGHELAPASSAKPGVSPESVTDPADIMLAAFRNAVARGAADAGKAGPAVRRDLPGRVTAAGSDDPVAGAKITVRWDFARSGGRWPEGGVYEWTAVSDHRGEFRFEELPAGAYRLVAAHAEYASRGHTGVEVRPAGETDPFPVHLVRDPAKLGAVEGVVLDPRGNAVEGAQVVVHNFHGYVRQEGVTGSDGSYRVERLLPGEYGVSVVRPPMEGEEEELWERIQKTSVGAGETARVDFRGSGTLSGILLDSEGRPIAGARILVTKVRGGQAGEDRRGSTGEDGRFSIPDAGVGRRSIAIGRGFASLYGKTIDLSGADREIEIRLDPGEITGKVLRPNGLPPYTAGLFPVIAAHRLDGDEEGPVAGTAVPEVTGVFRMEGMPPGRYRLKLFADGCRSATADVEIGWNAHRAGADFTLEPLVIGVVSVTVTDSDGRPVTGVRMDYGKQDGTSRRAKADMPSPGSYLVRMEVGTWHLVLSGDRLLTKNISIEVKKEDVTELRVEMSWQR